MLHAWRHAHGAHERIWQYEHAWTYNGSTLLSSISMRSPGERLKCDGEQDRGAAWE